MTEGICLNARLKITNDKLERKESLSLTRYLLLFSVNKKEI